MLTINNTVEGYLKDIEIKGNTWQDSENLADIRSVGTKVEGQELYEIPVLSTGKNLFNSELVLGSISEYGAIQSNDSRVITKDYIRINSSFNYVLSGYSSSTYWAFYDMDYKFISRLYRTPRTLTSDDIPKNAQFVKICIVNIADTNIKVQLEEGTQATPYEPYKEDKLTILSPTPLERVGNVTDRIICKNGVYGVEKNIGDYTFDTSLLNLIYSPNNTNIQYYAENILPNALKDISSVNNINNFCPSINRDDRKSCVTISCWSTTSIAFAMPKDMYPTIKDFKNSIPKEIEFRYILEEPQFIPLPHDQQVKLRTFADRTNIHFETDIQPTIKAQVPKSLGATVNSHTTQIDNLNKELDRVKKLEESTVSTVTSDKAFTTVAETNQGYFEDVKVEGKTLVNLLNIKDSRKSTGLIHYGITNIPISKKFTVYIKTSPSLDVTYLRGAIYKTLDENSSALLAYNACYINKPFLVNVNNEVEGTTYRIFVQNNNSGVAIDFSEDDIKVTILEGDHTDKDISYFEGLKSVGQDTDEISVSSVNDNLYNVSMLELVRNGVSSARYYYGYSLRNLIVGKKYVVTSEYRRWFKISTHLEGSNTLQYTGKNTFEFTMNEKMKKEYLFINNEDITVLSDIKLLKDICIVESGKNESMIPQKQDKKQILYYNPTTQTWEKPILREWDSIEKHSDGKYYYHKRSDEIVLNGSENWTFNSIKGDYTVCHIIKKGYYSKEYISNFNCSQYSPELDEGNIENIYFASDGVIYFKVSSNKLTSQNLTGFKQWLQANNVTVVYQLAQEEVYECTNLDLITYNGETNLIVSSGVIQPKITLKVLSNVSNVVKLLQEKVSILENNTSSYIVTQNRLQLASTYAADSVTFKVDYASAFDNRSVDGYNPDLYNLILSNILVGKDNYDYDKMFSIILDYASWDQISWEQFDELVLLMDIQHNPPIEIPEEDYTEEEIPEI